MPDLPGRVPSRSSADDDEDCPVCGGCEDFDDTGHCWTCHQPPCNKYPPGACICPLHDLPGRVTSSWGEAYLDTTELARRLRRVLRRLDDRCVVPEIMTEVERTLTRDYCREMETLHARRESNDA